MIHKTLSIIVICLFLLLPSPIYSASIKEDYELQERCGKRSEEVFKRDYGREGVKIKNEHGFEIYYTRNHYSKVFNKCFQIIEYVSCKKDGVVTFKVTALKDVNENKSYGDLWESYNPDKISNCSVSGITCDSVKGWNLLVKPYMEE